MPPHRKMACRRFTGRPLVVSFLALVLAFWLTDIQVHSNARLGSHTGAGWSLRCVSTAAARPRSSYARLLVAARASMKAGKLAKAKAQALKAVKLRPSAADGHFLLGLVAFKQGDFKTALRGFTNAATSSPPMNTPRLSFNRGATYFSLEKFRLAERAFVEAATKAKQGEQVGAAVDGADTSEIALAYLNAATAAIEYGNLNGAKEHLDELARADVERVFLSEQAALKQEIAARQQLSDAGASYKHDADVSGGTSWFSPGDVLKQARKAGLEKLKEDDPGAAVDIFKRAIRNIARRSKEALSDPKLASETKLIVGELHYELAYALMEFGNLKAAAKQIDVAIDQSPGEADYHLLRGLIADERGQRQTVRQSMSQALGLGLQPSDVTIAERRLNRLETGLAASGGGVFVLAEIAAGVDNNVAQLALGSDQLSFAGLERRYSYFTSVVLDVAFGKALFQDIFLELGYSLNSTLFPESAFDSFGFQTHQVSAITEWKTSRWTRLGLSTSGAYNLFGLRDISPFSWTECQH